VLLELGISPQAPDGPEAERATEVLGSTPASASANLGKLAEFGVVAEVTGRQRNQVFVAHDILAFVGREPRRV
jgi:hypothetical protein